MRTAVVGHVEWVLFARVERVPEPGEIVPSRGTWEQPAGGGAVAAAQLARLAGSATLYTALGDDEVGRRAREELERVGVRVEAAVRTVPTRRAFTFVDANGERTITTLGERLGPYGADPLPWGELASTDGVYFTAGDRGALEAGRRARVLVATSRVLPDLAAAAVPLDALVGSASDASERYEEGALSPAPRLVVRTEGTAGGTYRTDEGDWVRYPAVPIPGPVVDTYGAGDSFAAGLTHGLAAGMGVEEALELAARCGAEALTRRGAY